MKDNNHCLCSLCEAERLSLELGRTVHPWELIYGIDSRFSQFVREYPNKPIWFYDNLFRNISLATQS